MAINDEDYLRRYLDDPTTIDSTPVPQAIDDTPIDTNVDYYRKWLKDPNA